MFGNTFRQHFQVMGADVDVSVAGDRFQIGIDDGPGGERFQLRFPSDGSVTAKVLDADRRAQHLLLGVAHRGLGMQQKYLCGHDEFHWFVAALPQRRDVKTLSEAMEAAQAPSRAPRTGAQASQAQAAQQAPHHGVRPAGRMVLRAACGLRRR